MYGDEHKCEVSSRDLDSLRWDMERKVEDVLSDLRRLERQLDSMRNELHNHTHED